MLHLFHSKKLHGPKQYSNNCSHPGFAWGMTRSSYEITGGMYELSTLGSSFFNMAISLLNIYSLHCAMAKEYKESLNKLMNKSKNL